MTDRFEKFVILIFFLFLVSAIGIGLYATLVHGEEIIPLEGSNGLLPNGTSDIKNQSSTDILIQEKEKNFNEKNRENIDNISSRLNTLEQKMNRLLYLCGK